MDQTHTTPVLPWRFIVPSGLLIAIYAMLSYVALVDQPFFYESMEIPTPANDFLLWSWGGKNTAVLVGLVVAAVTRYRFMVLAAMAMLVVMQMGDVNAGARSGVNVFVTWIAFALTVLQVGLVIFTDRMNGNKRPV